MDADGDFHVTSRITGPGHVGVAYTGPGRHHLGEYQTYPRDVYEFRSGMLIPGRMVRARKFVPDEGGRVTRFADYRFDPRARPVWNLPGYFATGAAAGPWTRTRSAYNLPHAHDPR